MPILPDAISSPVAGALPDRSKTITIRLSDVARLAQCSAATVSRVLNAPESVNRNARLRVEAAVEELGYTRNGAARALRSRRSQIVGVILPTLRQPVYADFVGPLQDRLDRSGYALIVTTSGYSLDQELSQARLLSERGIDGLVLVGHTHRPALFTLLESQRLPFVTTYTFRPELGRPVVGFDDLAAMRRVVDHLFDLGHRRFAMLSGFSAESDRVEERIRGARSALEARGAELGREKIVEEAFTVQGGRVGMARLLEGPSRPTAVICGSDLLAYGALIECRARGVAVPAELSVVGFDDLQTSAHMLPALTSLAIPSEEMGRRAADHLLARLGGRDTPSQVSIATRLMVRDTTAPPPTRGVTQRVSPAAGLEPDAPRNHDDAPGIRYDDAPPARRERPAPRV